jgi:DNA-binding NtrC family response regulator
LKRVLLVSTRKDWVGKLANHARSRWVVHVPKNPRDAPSLIASRSWDFVLFDFDLDGLHFSDLLTEISAVEDHPPVFAMGKESCGAFRRLCHRCGISGFFRLSHDIPSLIESIDRFYHSIHPEDDASVISGAIPSLDGVLLGRSPAIIRLRQKILSIGKSRDPVLVTGETGTGKDLVARLIHLHSSFSAGPCVIQNMSCIAPGVAESELFGSVRGAYTDAPDREGLFEAANGGTLFLDEIGDLPAALQPKLLRVLEDGNVCRLGSRQVRHVDFRLICATNKSLGGAVESGAFRRDLFHRIDVIRLELPALRSHPEDIGLLSRHRLRSSGKRLSRHALDKLCLHRWPGNVRELYACLARASCASETEVILPEQILF